MTAAVNVDSGAQANISVGAEFTFSFGVASVAGESIIVEIAGSNTTAASTSYEVRDDKSNIYTPIEFVSESSAHRAVGIYACLGATAGAKQLWVKNLGGTGGWYGRAGAQRVTAITALDRHAQKATIDSSSAMAITNPGADTGTDDFVATACSIGDAANQHTFSNPPTTGYSTSFYQDDESSTTAAQGAYRINSTAPTDSASWGTSSATSGVCAIASFKTSAVSGGVVNSRMAGGMREMSGNLA